MELRIYTVEVWEWISNFISHLMMDVITYQNWHWRWIMSVKGMPYIRLFDSKRSSIYQNIWQPPTLGLQYWRHLTILSWWDVWWQPADYPNAGISSLLYSVAVNTGNNDNGIMTPEPGATVFIDQIHGKGERGRILIASVCVACWFSCIQRNLALSIPLFFSLSMHISLFFVSVSVHLSIHPSIRPSIHTSIHTSL